jgi:hypothetical protein
MKNVTVHLKPWIIICRGHIRYKKFARKKKIRNRIYNSKSGIFLNYEDATSIIHIHCFVRCLRLNFITSPVFLLSYPHGGLKFTEKFLYAKKEL